MPRKYKIKKRVARERARAAGSVSSPAKAEAARENGTKGGRPADNASLRQQALIYSRQHRVSLRTAYRHLLNN